MTSSECNVRGGATIAVKGKNLESKEDDGPNLKVSFHHKESNWTALAKVFHKVTTVSCYLSVLSALNLVN